MRRDRVAAPVDERVHGEPRRGIRGVVRGIPGTDVALARDVRPYARRAVGRAREPRPREVDQIFAIDERELFHDQSRRLGVVVECDERDLVHASRGDAFDRRGRSGDVEPRVRVRQRHLDARRGDDVASGVASGVADRVDAFGRARLFRPVAHHRPRASRVSPQRAGGGDAPIHGLRDDRRRARSRVGASDERLHGFDGPHVHAKRLRPLVVVERGEGAERDDRRAGVLAGPRFRRGSARGGDAQRAPRRQRDQPGNRGSVRLVSRAQRGSVGDGDPVSRGDDAPFGDENLVARCGRDARRESARREKRRSEHRARRRACPPSERARESAL